MIVPNVVEVVTAIAKEKSEIPEYIELEVLHREDHDPIWSFEVQPKSRGHRAPLDESLEGARAWWTSREGEGGGTADVLAVDTENSTVHLRFLTGPPPEEGAYFRIYAPDFLAGLLEVWKGQGELCRECLRRIVSPAPCDEQSAPSTPPAFRESLRARQRDAMKLLKADLGWLWGPPGTGKTYTLGRMLATLLVGTRDSRVLLIGPTNVAVDQAIVALDEALEVLTTQGSQDLRTKAAEARNKVKRIGTRFQAAHYQGRQHLIPKADEALLEQLAAHERDKPPVEPVEAYEKWRKKRDELRAKVQESLQALMKDSRLLAMTATRALFEHEALRDPSARLTYVVMDESSQIGLATAAAIGMLGKRVLFAGDPCQLAPIIQSENQGVKDWLGRSPFVGKIPSRTVQLVEQSRMAAEICGLISRLFYGGALTVAEKEAQDGRWNNERRVPATNWLGEQRAVVEFVQESGRWDHRIGSAHRPTSAEWVVQCVEQLVRAGTPQREILVLSPFRSQRFGIQRQLRARDRRDVQVSTVHRAQGGERHTIVFDSTFESTAFLKKPDTWRLLNVALSRAKARIVVVLSDQEWRGSSLMVVLVHCMRGGVIGSVKDMLEQPFFPSAGDEAYYSIPRIRGIVECEHEPIGYPIGWDPNQKRPRSHIRFRDVLAFTEYSVPLMDLKQAAATLSPSPIPEVLCPPPRS